MWFKKKTVGEKLEDFFHNKAFRKRRSVVGWFDVFMLCLFLFILIVLIFAVPLGIWGVKAMNESIVVQSSLSSALEYSFAGDLGQASLEMEKARVQLPLIRQDLSKLGPIRLWPSLNRNLRAVDQLLVSADKLLLSYGMMLEIFEDTGDQFNLDSIGSGFFNSESRQEILKLIVENQNELEEIKEGIEEAKNELAKINSNDLTGVFQKYLALADFILNEAIEGTEMALPILGNLPDMLGYGGEKTYLILFQNNMELRPTGGFIGSYGLLAAKNGEVEDIFTDDIYNLDKLSEGKMAEIPPEAMIKYNNLKHWYLRDANWSPDWPTSAEQILWFFNRERQNAGLAYQEIDGVIAITPDFIANILAVLGPINVDGIDFKAENFSVDLEKFVEFDYVHHGIDTTDRKDIISDLSKMILEQVYQAGSREAFDLWLAFKKNIDEKNILVYFLDEDLQSYFYEQNWSGQVKHNEGDYFMVVDANLAALKTDQVMERKIDYGVSIGDYDELIGELRVSYIHKGTAITGLITRYRDFVRVYLPNDTWILESYIDDGVNRQNLKVLEDLDITEELGKRVASTFFTVEPGQTKTLVLRYKLPDYIRQQYTLGLYKLLVQKQPGTSGHNFDFHLDFNKPINAYSADDFPAEFGGDYIRWDSDLSVDREFIIRL